MHEIVIFVIMKKRQNNQKTERQNTTLKKEEPRKLRKLRFRQNKTAGTTKRKVENMKKCLKNKHKN